MTAPIRQFYDVHDVATGVADSLEGRRLIGLATGRTVLEVGSQHGGSAVLMGRVAKRVVAVDWHRGDDHATRMDTVAGFWANLKRHGVLDVVIPVVARFEDAAGLLVPATFDLAFIDAQHHYEDARRHVRLALPLLKAGGTVAVHDYGWHAFPGVQKAVDELCGGRPREVVGTLAIFAKEDVRAG